MPPTSSDALTPFTLQPLLVERIWGVETLNDWYPQPAPGTPIGEVWLTAEQCRSESDGRTLAELAAAEPESLGNVSGEGFPLLIKLLYPREKLSVQVHPDDAQARATLNQPRGKTECWYVLSAEPGAQIALGFREHMSLENIRTSIEDGTIESKLRMVPVKAGDMVFVDANTIHAIGPGMVVLETQQYSDVTYRLWDYGRPRQLHIEAGLAVTRPETSAGVVEPIGMGSFDRLIDCAYFAVDRFQSDHAATRDLGGDGQLQILIPLGDGCELSSGDIRMLLRAGHATVLPASAGAYALRTPANVQVIRILAPAEPSS